MRGTQRCPGWFLGLFVAAMLIVCVFLAQWTVEQAQLRARIADLEISLDTSRGREARQAHEYDVAVQALPLAQAELERVAPLAEEAKAQEQELRQQRKAIRAENDALLQQVAEAQAELDKLLEQATALESAAESIRSILGGP